MPETEITKSDWEKIRSGAAVISGDDRDEAPSGTAIETYGKKVDIESSRPENSANSKTGSPGPDAKGGKILGAQVGAAVSGMSKAQAALLKAMEDPHVLKALDTLEKAGVLKEDEAEPEVKLYKAAPDVEARFAAIEKSMSTIVKGIEALVKRDNSELQKMGLVEVGQITPKPGLAKLEQNPAYSQGQSALVKAATAAEDAGIAPDFTALASERIKGVWQ